MGHRGGYTRMAGELESSLHEDRDKKHLYKYTVEHSVGLDHIKEYGPQLFNQLLDCLLYTSPSPRDRQKSRMPSSA